jgi:general secretion pathway protein A
MRTRRAATSNTACAPSAGRASRDSTSEAFAALHRFTGGIPRRLNTTCDRLLLFGFLEEKTHFGEAEVNEVIADLKNEVAHQDFHGATGVNNHAAAWQAC